MAERGVFSPRLMHFLAIDVTRVHIEEELRIVKLLSDQSTVTKGSPWQIVDEKWLGQWRRFVLGTNP